MSATAGIRNGRRDRRRRRRRRITAIGSVASPSATDWNAQGQRYRDLCARILGKGIRLDERMGDKPVFKTLRRLITQEWRTSLSTKTDSSGRVAFRGFRGKYEADFGEGAVVRFEVR